MADYIDQQLARDREAMLRRALEIQQRLQGMKPARAATMELDTGTSHAAALEKITDIIGELRGDLVPVSVGLSPEMVELLDQAATRERRSRTSLMAAWLTEMLEQKGYKPPEGKTTG
jgi:hypothetical protein